MARKREPSWQPNQRDYDRIFQEQSPWHQSGEVPAALARPVERPLARYLPSRVLADSPRRFQLILGPRRVGKTTLMYQMVKHLLAQGIARDRLWWLRLDHPLLMELPLDVIIHLSKSSIGATEERPIYFFLDELSYALQWDLWLKTFYDDKWPVRIVGTSSSTAALKTRKMESGVGRWEEQHLAPYLFTEYLQLIEHPMSIPVQATFAETLEACVREQVDVASLAEPRRRFLITGGFPELLIGNRNDPTLDEASVLLQSQRTLRNDAVERAIYKDIPQVFGVDDPMMLERVLYTLAGQLTGILSPISICSDLGLSQPTFNRYLNYLEQAFLVFTLPNYSSNEASVQRRGKKLYFVDGAVRNAALQRGLGPLTDRAEMGLLIENLVAGHLRALGNEEQVRLYYWRDKNDEVDLVYDHPEHPFALEIGQSSSHHRNGIHAFEAKHARFKGRCYIVSPDARAVSPKDRNDGVGTLPLDLLLAAAGARLETVLEKRLARAT